MLKGSNYLDAFEHPFFHSTVLHQSPIHVIQSCIKRHQGLGDTVKFIPFLFLKTVLVLLKKIYFRKVHSLKMNDENIMFEKGKKYKIDHVQSRGPVREGG